MVRATQETMVFAVRSRTNKKTEYRCDLLSNGGFGECACRDWAIRRWPAIKAGAEPGTRDALCIHLIAARRFFLNDLLQEMSKNESRP